jgi:predicted aspartyl protease
VATLRPTRRQIAGWSAAAGLAAVAPAFAQAPAPSVPAPQPGEPVTDPTEPPANVPTAVGKFDQITAPVTINGAGPFTFLIDTGASRSCLTPQLAEALKLPAGPMVAVNTLVGRHMRPTAIIDSLQVGPRSQRQVRVPVLPITMQVDGVLGVDWLKGQRLVLGLKAQRLEITSPRAEQPQPNRVIVPARRRQGQLTIIDADLGGARINAMIDSGSQVSIANAALRAQIQKESWAPPRAERVALESVSGERFYGEQIYLPFLRLGGLQLGNVPIVFSEVYVFGFWRLKGAPTVILGMDLLNEFTEVAMDYGRATVRFDFAGDRKVESMQP